MTKTDLDGIYLCAFEKGKPNEELDLDVCILNTSDKPKTLVIPAKGYTKIDHFSDEGELDFTTNYNIKVGNTTYMDDISAACFFRDSIVDIPIVNRKGYLGGFRK